jgi:hypothetical protein
MNSKSIVVLLVTLCLICSNNGYRYSSSLRIRRSSSLSSTSTSTSTPSSTKWDVNSWYKGIAISTIANTITVILLLKLLLTIL